MIEQNEYEGEELDIEPFEGEPDAPGHLADENGDQDTEEDANA